MKKKTFLTPGKKLFLILLLIPISIVFYYLSFIQWKEFHEWTPFNVLHKMGKIQQNFDLKIPEEYIPIYMEAGEKYQIPWTLLAAHHRVETKFSTMDPLISPAGAEGPMQFMPCTFVGWKHPSCSNLGKGDIPEEEKTDPKIIAKYGGYGIDANHDGKADPFDLEDSIFSAANYLSKAGASEGQLEKAIYQYNHSEQYVDDILYYYRQYESMRSELEEKIIVSK